MPETSAAGDEEFTFASPAPRDPPVQNPLLTKATVTTSSPTAGRPHTELLERVVARRKKVPFEIGYNPLDWLRLCKSKTDLSGLKGSGLRRDITLAEVALHRTPEDAWTVIRGKVYNLTPYMKYHPGGARVLYAVMGKDGTKLFDRYHPWVNIDFLMAGCLIGRLEN